LENPEPVTNNLFLIGAGFTSAVFPEAPLNKGLLLVLCKGTSCTTLKKYYREYKTDDIEILLTRLDLEILRPTHKQKDLRQVREVIEQQLAKYFEQFRFKKEVIEDNSWLGTFTKLFNRNDAIITLNYDCLLEGLLDYYKAWSPSKGYGSADVMVDVPGTSFEKLPNPQNILIYKIHGSENFRTCGIKDKGIDAYHIGLAVSEEIYPESGKYSSLGVVQDKSYIIAPSFVKTFYPQIELMIVEVLEVAKKAKNFVIIGCGLRPEDSFLWLIMAAFLSRKPDKPIIIVDPKAEPLRDRIKDYWRDAKVNTIAKGIEKGIDDLLSLIKVN
jgi:hypothetical protein